MFVFVCVVVSVFVCLFVIVFVLMFVFVIFFVLAVVFAKPATRRPIMGKRANPPAPSRRMGTMANPPALSKAKAKPATRRPVRDRWTYEPVAELGTSLIAITHIHSPKVPIVTEAVILNIRMDGGSSDSDIEDDCLCYDWDLVHGKCIGRCKFVNYGLRFFTGVCNFHFCTTWDETVSEGQQTSTEAKRSKVMVLLPKSSDSSFA